MFSGRSLWWDNPLQRLASGKLRVCELESSHRNSGFTHWTWWFPHQFFVSLPEGRRFFPLRIVFFRTSMVNLCKNRPGGCVFLPRGKGLPRPRCHASKLSRIPLGAWATCLMRMMRRPGHRETMGKTTVFWAFLKHGWIWRTWGFMTDWMEQKYGIFNKHRIYPLVN